jgi:hypothetical protein
VSWVIDLRNAEHDGVLGAWRMTDASMGPHPANEARLSVTLTLVEQGQSLRPAMLQLHDYRAFVPVLVPAPEPQPREYPHGPVVLRSGRLEVRLLDE